MQKAFDPSVPIGNSAIPAYSLSREMSGRSSEIPSLRVTETRPRYPGYLIPIVVLTVTFLVGALSFSARLIDAIGSPISSEQLSALSAWTWVLGGIALTLFTWGSVVLPHASRAEHSVWRIGRALLISAIVCCESAYLVGPVLISRIEGRATAVERQCAVQLRVLSEAREEGSVAPAPLQIQPLLLTAPVGGLYCKGLPAVSANGLSTALRGIATRHLGTAEQVYDTSFIPSVRSLRDAYNGYVAAQVRLVTDIDSIPVQQSQAWQQYLERLAKAGLALSHIPRQDWPQIAEDVRKMGVPVSSNWNPTDRATFMMAAATAFRHAANAAYDNTLMQHLEQTLVPGRSWEAFYSEPMIQARWRSLVGAPAAATLSPDMGFSAFTKTVYEPRLNNIVQPGLSNLLSSADAFAERGRLSAAGRAGATWAITPPMLFYIAILLILGHAGQLLVVGCQILLPSVRTSTRWAVAACMACVVMLVMAWPSLRTGAPPSAGDDHDVVVCPGDPKHCNAGMRLGGLWMLGSGLRHAVLVGFDFGYNARTANEPSEEPLASVLASDTVTQ